ncbi:S-adenosylmethionine-dependent methyltransferase [Rhodococcus aerolatus]
MALELTGDDVRWLRSGAGQDALAVADGWELTPASLLADVGAARSLAGGRGAALLETARLRRRAVGKLADPGRWLLTEDALAQATPAPVARHRAARLTGRRVHDVTCSVGAELGALAATAEHVLGSDLDPVRLAMAAHNAPGVALARADALSTTSRGTVLVADPARRSGGRRTHDPAATAPPLPALLAAHAGRDLVVKCAPGLDPTRLGWDGEVELVSLDGAVREACLWSPALATARRRATVLSSTGPGWAVTDADPDDAPVREPGRYLVEPDGAVVRAGLVRHLAARHGLGLLDPRIAHLTGDVAPTGLRSFAVLEQGRFSEKALRRALTARGAGSVEVLVRGVDVDPAVLRPRLGLRRGGAALAVVITRIGTSPQAFVCEPGRTAP